MAEPVRKPIESDLLDEEPGMTLERWVERPGGRMELVEMPLTPELFLNPRFGDHMTQGKRHGETVYEIYGALVRFFGPIPDVVVTYDVQHRFGPGLSQPSPDVSVIRGVRDKKADRKSFDIAAEGVRPCLVVEVVSPLSSRIRKTDMEDKVALYRRVGIQEYLIVDCQRHDRHYRLLGYRLGSSGYQRVELDEQERFLSETTGLWFQVTPDGDHVRTFEHPSGRLLLTHDEEADLRSAAEEKARVAEDEVARLRAELDRLRGPR
ncbi:MAG: Uma2 family endonuclease [Acidobacteriota bacterium]